MPSTYSPLLRIQLIATGEQSGTWGDTTNTNLGTLIEDAIAGSAAIDVTSGNVTLTSVDGLYDQSRCAAIRVSGTPGVSRNIIAPAASHIYVVANGSNAAVVLKTSSSTGLTIPTGQIYLAYYDPTVGVADFKMVGQAIASTNTANTLVLRDASGNFSAGTITANLTGNVTGNASTVTTNANLTGAVTSVGNATSLGSFTSANLAAALTDETGSGANVFATSPTLVTPLLGIPTSGTLTNCTGLPVGTGVSGLGTGVATFLATPSSANLAAALTDETGTGLAVFATSPTLVTPALGTPSALVGTNITGTAAGLSIGGSAATATTATNQSGGTVAATTGSFSGVATFSAGTASLPAITTTGDTNTGIFFPAADTIAFTEGGAEAMRISSSGNLGIGTTNPSSLYRLDVVGDARITNAPGADGKVLITGGACTLNLTATDADYTILSGSGNSKGVAILMGGAGICVFDNASSNMGVDVVSPLVKLDVDGQIKGRFTSVGTNIAAQALATNHVSEVTISADTTLTTTVPAAGAQALVIIVTSGTTSRTVTFGTGFATTGTLATGTAASRRFVVSFISDGTRLIECSRTTAITV
jgi:hypothetical protein